MYISPFYFPILKISAEVAGPYFGKDENANEVKIPIFKCLKVSVIGGFPIRDCIGWSRINVDQIFWH